MNKKYVGALIMASALLLGGGCSGSRATGQAVAVGPDSGYWLVDPRYARVDQITSSGAVRFFALSEDAKPSAIVEGPDGNMWFTEAGRGRIGRITRTGAVSEYPIPSSGAEPTQIVASPPNRIWFLESNGRLGTTSTSGAMSEYLPPFTLLAIATVPGGGVIGTGEGSLVRISASGAMKVVSIK